MSADTTRNTTATETPDTIIVPMVWHIVKGRAGSLFAVDPKTLPNPHENVLVYRERRGVHLCIASDVNETGVLVWENNERDPDNGLYGDCFLICEHDCWLRIEEIPDIPQLAQRLEEKAK